jgi:hypothetical protein
MTMTLVQKLGKTAKICQRTDRQADTQEGKKSAISRYDIYRLAEEEDFVEEFGRDCDELVGATEMVGAPVDPEDIGRTEAFSFA